MLIYYENIAYLKKDFFASSFIFSWSNNRVLTINQFLEIRNGKVEQIVYIRSVKSSIDDGMYIRSSEKSKFILF